MKTLVRSLRDIDTAVINLQNKLNYHFNNIELLIEALTHPSFCVEQSKSTTNNQRLEFLGDTVWQMILTDVLFKRFPTWAEGELTKVRSFLSRTQCMASFARELGISECLLLGKGETQSGGTDRDSNLEDAFEALFGAIYLDCNDFSTLKNICISLVDNILNDEKKLIYNENPKGSLQEFTQAQYGVLPEYHVAQITGPAHAPEFTIELKINQYLITSAVAKSRKMAEHQAAKNALMILQQTPMKELLKEQNIEK